MASQTADPFLQQRLAMVDTQIRKREVTRPEVLAAMERVPRHRFVPTERQDQAYDDTPLPIGAGQTISQPYVVALMSSLLELQGDEKVLEIGTGSGYQAAVLAEIASQVFTIEIIESLGRRAQEILSDLGYTNVHVRIGDGYKGWPEEAPFDAVVVTAAPERIPEPLLEQLKVGGRMVIPVGAFFQDLMVITKTEEGIYQQTVSQVRFVPMTGEIQVPPS